MKLELWYHNTTANQFAYAMQYATRQALIAINVYQRQFDYRANDLPGHGTVMLYARPDNALRNVLLANNWQYDRTKRGWCWSARELETSDSSKLLEVAAVHLAKALRERGIPAAAHYRLE